MKPKIIIALILLCSMPFAAFAAEKKVESTTVQKDTNGTVISRTYKGTTNEWGKSDSFIQVDSVDSTGKLTSTDINFYRSDGTPDQTQSQYYDSTGKIVTYSQSSSFDTSGNRIADMASDYDSAGNKILTMQTNYNPAGAKTDVVQTHYDAAGNQTSSSVVYYDAAGNQIGEPVINSGTPATNSGGSGKYQQLSPITDPRGEAVDTTSLPSYLNVMYRIGIGLCFALGVIMFTWAGIEYIVSESMNTKGDAKKRIAAALTGLAIALVSYILLNTINPDLLELRNINTTTPTTP